MTDYETAGYYRPSDRQSFGTVLTLLCIGLGIGALAALLLTPKPGKEVRSALRRGYEAIAD